MNIKNVIKSILIFVGLFLIGSVLGFLLEGNYRQFVRFLFKLFNGNNIQFEGKNIYLFASDTFILASSLYFPIVYSLLYKKSNTKKIKISLLTIILFFVTTVLITAIDSKLLIMQCTACDDGILRLSYNGVSYNKYFLISLIFSLLYLIYCAIKQNKP